MDSFEITKIGGALCGSLLIFLVIQTGAHAIIGDTAGGHGEGHENAYVIEVSEEGGEMTVEEAAPEVDFAEVYAAADPAAGESLFRACGSCHRLEEGANAVGPHLYGIVGREIAAESFAYSDALAALEGQWTPEELSEFLENPAGYAPGTKMSYRGMGDVEDRADLIAYLDSVGG